MHLLIVANKGRLPLIILMSLVKVRPKLTRQPATHMAGGP
jgi:hypothetical protein